ncbi:hypothetical protein COLO4_03926 [Corchorus olitorius]|uniref:Uncharacterized protein n=1 Tax=Corchorus olitorius TaxID=93759 RepID=A0A1R3KW76_9ROSI|nr:hypothetical protein COLO4_03926 [Corchorus olitorius]
MHDFSKSDAPTTRTQTSQISKSPNHGGPKRKRVLKGTPLNN